LQLKIKDLKERDEDLFSRGDMICSTEDYCQVTNEILAKIYVLELPEHKRIMSEGYSSVLHMHTCVQEVEISAVEAVLQAGKLAKATFLTSGKEGFVKITVTIVSWCSQANSAQSTSAWRSTRRFRSSASLL